MRLACVGDNVVDIYPNLRLVFPGGNAVNVAVAARRAGLESAYLGALGTDRSGKILLEALIDEEVEISRTRVIEGPNAYSTIDLVDGDRIFGAADVGVSRFRLDGDDLEYLAGFDMAHTGDNSMCEDQVSAMAEAAPLSYDFGERPPEYWRPLARHVEVAFFSAGQRSAEEAEDLARSAAALGPKLVVVTEGARGAMVLVANAVHRVTATVTPVDTLGAGDSLIGRFLAGIMDGEEPPDALEAASAAAAETCLHHGAFGYVTSYGPDSRHNGAVGHPWPLEFDRHAHPDRTATTVAPSPGGLAT